MTVLDATTPEMLREDISQFLVERADRLRVLAGKQPIPKLRAYRNSLERAAIEIEGCARDLRKCTLHRQGE